MSPSWQQILAAEFDAAYFRALEKFLAEERTACKIFPPEEDVFTAFHLTPFEAVRVVVLGQDPYHGEGEAHGLAFSVRAGVKVPPSLKNILKELESDTGLSIPTHGDLTAWARQGVLLLNTVLTVRANQANSHRKQGWETFTDAVIRAVNQKPESMVFVLWGKPAQQKKKLIDLSRHAVIESAHPSPLSAHTGFFGSRPFSKINAALLQVGIPQIKWWIE